MADAGFETSEERLRALLGLGRESNELDYKEKVDLGATRDKVEFAKDVGAFRALGGHLIIGARDDGAPGGLLTEAMLKKLDEATLTSVLAKYLAPPLGVSVGRHKVDGHDYAVVHVEASEDGVAIFTNHGEYTDASAKTKAKPTVVFRKGDVFVREGTRSERWQPHHLQQALERVMAQRKDAWRKDRRDDIVDILKENALALSLSRGPTRALDWNLDSDTYEEVIVEQLRRDDLVPVKLLLERIAPALEDATANESEELHLLLDRIAAVGSIAIRLDAAWLFQESIDALHRGYVALPKAAEALHQAEHGRTCLAFLYRLYGLGALAVRNRSWASVPQIVVRDSPPAGWLWLREALVWAARANLIEGTEKAPHLISRAHAWLRDQAPLRRDEPNSDNALLDSLLQFDVLVAVTAIWAKKDGDFEHWYPNFVHFYPMRVEPVVERLVGDRSVQAALGFQGPDQVAGVVATLEAKALEVKRIFSSFRGFSSPKVRAFLAEYRQD